MPRDNVTVTDLTSGVAVANPAGVAINPANGALVLKAGETERLLFRVTNTSGASRDVIFKASTARHAIRRGLGDLVIAIPPTSERIVVLESARFKQADGSIQVDFAASTTGAISVVRLPGGC